MLEVGDGTCSWLPSPAPEASWGATQLHGQRTCARRRHVERLCCKATRVCRCAGLLLFGLCAPSSQVFAEETFHAEPLPLANCRVCFKNIVGTGGFAQSLKLGLQTFPRRMGYVKSRVRKMLSRPVAIRSPFRNGVCNHLHRILTDRSLAEALFVSWRRQADRAHQRVPRAADGGQQPLVDRQGLQAAQEGESSHIHRNPCAGTSKSCLVCSGVDQRQSKPLCAFF